MNILILTSFSHKSVLCHGRIIANAIMILFSYKNEFYEEDNHRPLFTIGHHSNVCKRHENTEYTGTKCTHVRKRKIS